MGRPLLYWHSGGTVVAKLGSHKPKGFLRLEHAYDALRVHLTEGEAGPEFNRAFNLKAATDLAKALIDAERWALAAAYGRAA